MGNVKIDLSNSGREIGKTLFNSLNSEQKNELALFVIEQSDVRGIVDYRVIISGDTRLEFSDRQLITINEGEISLSLESRTVTIRGKQVNLCSSEFDIFASFVMNPGRVFTYEMIGKKMLYEKNIISHKPIHDFMCRLRKKLQTVSNLQGFIKSVRGVGYKFEYD